MLTNLKMNLTIHVTEFH